MRLGLVFVFNNVVYNIEDFTPDGSYQAPNHVNLNQFEF